MPAARLFGPACLYWTWSSEAIGACSSVACRCCCAARMNNPCARNFCSRRGVRPTRMPPGVAHTHPERHFRTQCHLFRTNGQRPVSPSAALVKPALSLAALWGLLGPFLVLPSNLGSGQNKPGLHLEYFVEQFQYTHTDRCINCHWLQKYFVAYDCLNLGP